jgi:hypothetical protein
VEEVGGKSKIVSCVSAPESAKANGRDQIYYSAEIHPMTTGPVDPSDLSSNFLSTAALYHLPRTVSVAAPDY